MPARIQRTAEPNQLALASKLRATGKKEPRRHTRNTPLWKGPSIDGITFSLLSRFLVCRERFRLLTVEGLKPANHFNPVMEYGSIWHVCEEAHAAGRSWQDALISYGQDLNRRYPLEVKQIVHWLSLAEKEFPVYVNHWSKHPDVKSRVPILQEEIFMVPYVLPSNNIVILKGKWDSVDLIRETPVGIYIQENKTKSSIDIRKITRQLKFDLQTMMYLIALESFTKLEPMNGKPCIRYKNGMVCTDKPINGVRYNVVRRSSHKLAESMLKKIYEDINDKRVDEWFLRMKVEVSAGDITKFKKTCLNPILETLVQWWNWTTTGTCDAEILAKNCHWRHPFGVYNVLDEGGSSEIDHYLETGSEAGLMRTNNLFPELTESGGIKC